MLPIALLLIATLMVAGIVVLYVAYPHRGHSMPVVPLVGEAMRTAADAIPLVDEYETDPDRLARR